MQQHVKGALRGHTQKFKGQITFNIPAERNRHLISHENNGDEITNVGLVYRQTQPPAR